MQTSSDPSREPLMLLLLFFCRMLIALHPCNIWMKRREVCSTTKSGRVQGRSQQPKSIHGFLGKKKKQTTIEVTACWVWGFVSLFMPAQRQNRMLGQAPMRWGGSSPSHPPFAVSLATLREGSSQHPGCSQSIAGKSRHLYLADRRRQRSAAAAGLLRR